MADLSLHIRELAARVGSRSLAPSPTAGPAPPGPPAANVGEVDPPAAGPAPPAPPVTLPTDRDALIERILGLPLDQFAEAGHGLEIRVPWAPVPLWFVPSEADVEALVTEGIQRGRIWTAAELRDLLAIRGLTKAQARLIAETKLAFEGEMAAEPTAPAEGAPGTPTVAPAPGSGWPAAVLGLGPKRVGPFTPCGVCGAGTWVSYGEAPRCRPCATGTMNPAASRPRCANVRRSDQSPPPGGNGRE